MNKVVAIIIALLVFGGSAYASYSYFSSGGGMVASNYHPPTNGDSETVAPDEPKTEECPLNGQLYSKTQKSKWEKRRPLIVMIENHPDARPQSGISSADNVYEAVAEGGITRFMNVFYCDDAKYVGPVRSARIYFVRMAQGYGNYPLYAHVGGANCDEETGSGCANGAKADALGQISKLGWAQYNDLSEFSVPFPNFYRDPDRLPNRATEHTVYTSTQKLWTYAATKRGLTNVDDKGTAWNSDFTPWNFKDDAKLADRGPATKVHFGFWSNSDASDFVVDWVYDKAANTYSRNTAEKPHVDKNTGKPLTAKNVIVVFADESPANDGYPGGHILYDIIGTGDGLLFQDGKAEKITWKKKDADMLMRFYDSSGKEVSLVRGKDFVEILPTGNKVDY